jgi:pimeloyl-ACP methyl ester carboxylesterase
MPNYTASDGTDLAYQSHGRGQIVVLIHAGFLDSRAWNGLTPMLVTDHTVVVPDRRGHGSSGGYRDGHRLSDDIDDLSTLVDLVTDATDPALLVAHSASCHIALGCALANPRIAGLILHEPPTFRHPPISDEVWARLEQAKNAGDRRQLAWLALNDVVGQSTGQTLPAPAFEAMLQSPFGRMLLDNALSLPAELQSYEAHHWDDESLRGLSTPTRLRVGAQSPPFNRLFADRLSALSSHATIEVLPGQDHGAPLNAPVALAGVIRAGGEWIRTFADGMAGSAASFGGDLTMDEETGVA